MSTKTTNAKAIEFIKATVDSAIKSDTGITPAKLRAHLLINDFASNDKDANALIREAGFSASRASNGFRARLYARLVAGNLDSKEFTKLISTESKNVVKHTKHFYGIVLLANAIRDGVELDSDIGDDEETS